MKLKLTAILFLLLVTTSIQAASDTDVSIIKAHKVVITENVVTIVAEAKTSIITISGDYKDGYKGSVFMGRPMSRITVKSDKATFTIRRPAAAQKAQSLEPSWEKTLKNARDLQEGNEVGRIGYYQPAVVIEKNLITSIDGQAFLYSKGQ